MPRKKPSIREGRKEFGDLSEVKVKDEEIKDPDSQPDTDGEESALRYLTDTYMAVQKVRIATGNKIGAIMRENDKTENMTAFLEKIEKMLYVIENDTKLQMAIVEEHPAWGWMGQVKGVGHIMGTKILGLIDDIGKFDTISKLWRYAGFAVIDGKAEKYVKGEPGHYNKKLKTTLYILGDSFYKSNSPFAKIGREAKIYYANNRPEWKADPSWILSDSAEFKAKSISKDQASWESRIAKAARRKMIKTFLSCLWLAWRQAEGLPIREPYVAEYKGHTTMYRPEDFIE